MLRAGDLDRRLTIRRPYQVDDGLATVTDVEAGLVRVWAQRIPISDGERGGQGGVMAQATVRFRIRWSSTVRDLNPKDSVVCEGRCYDIVGVKELGRREGLEITAAERTDD